ncbi:MAG: DNA-binding protein WhiA [Actinobacteria bacterium]|nr:DNA-binding protein WhiA [Actinomycetota bacterium]
MTYASDVREEVAHHPPAGDCCRRALLGAALRGAGTLHLTGGGHVHAELDVAGHAVGRLLLALLREEGATCGIRTYRPARLPAAQRVLLVLADDAASTRALAAAGVVDPAGRPLPPDPAIARRACCAASALAGAFAVAGTVSGPGRPALLEVRTHSADHAEVLRACGARLGIDLRVRERPRWAEVMTRRREAVQGLLSVIGADSAALDMAEDEVVRQARGAANRRANFDTANLGRQVAATRRQVRAIEVLAADGRLAALPAPLREAAVLRAAHPDLPLSELAQRGGCPRPTLAARLRRIAALAEEGGGPAESGSASA